MFHASMVKHRVSSRSGCWCCAPRVSVTRICELFHADKQQEYEQARRARCARGDNDCTRIHGMTAMKCEVPPYWKDMNEYLLYHGTSFRKAEGILQTGFDPQRGGDMTGSMFGKGTYFAQNASKSDLYTTCKECASDNFKECRHAQGERCILVARVLLGESFVETAPYCRHEALDQSTRPAQRHSARLCHWSMQSRWGGCGSHGVCGVQGEQNACTVPDLLRACCELQLQQLYSSSQAIALICVPPCLEATLVRTRSGGL